MRIIGSITQLISLLFWALGSPWVRRVLMHLLTLAFGVGAGHVWGFRDHGDRTPPEHRLPHPLKDAFHRFLSR